MAGQMNHVAALAHMNTMRGFSLTNHAEPIGKRIAELETALVEIEAEESAAVEAHAAKLASVRANADEAAAKILKDGTDKTERLAAELRGDLARVRADMNQKDAKIKEIQSKFSFIIGTVTERTEVK